MRSLIIASKIRNAIALGCLMAVMVSSSATTWAAVMLRLKPNEIVPVFENGQPAEVTVTAYLDLTDGQSQAVQGYQVRLELDLNDGLVKFLTARVGSSWGFFDRRVSPDMMVIDVSDFDFSSQDRPAISGSVPLFEVDLEIQPSISENYFININTDGRFTALADPDNSPVPVNEMHGAMIIPEPTALSVLGLVGAICCGLRRSGRSLIV